MDTQYNKLKDIKVVVTHAGVMHADDVFATAYINIVRSWFHKDPVQIIRSFKIYKDQTIDNGYLVIDVGGGEFDHHFPDDKKEKRPDGVPYAAFGLVAKAFHYGFFTEDEYNLFDKKFVEPLDYNDNNGSGNQLAYAIASFNRNWDDENHDTDSRFIEAVRVATLILNEYIGSIRSLARAKNIADNAIVEGETVYLDQYVPINEFFINNNDVKFIGSPAIRGGYQIVSIKNNKGENKKLFPAYLRGYNPGEGIYNEAGINFCHSSGFMATFRDKECAHEFMDMFQYYKGE